MKISLITVCCQRWQFLAKSLPSWKLLPDRGTTFVVTYTFDDPPADLEGFTLLTIDADRFHKARALNAAARIAVETDDPDYLLFIDSDIVVRDPRVFSRALDREPRPDFVLDSVHAPGEELSHDDPERGDRGKRGTHLVRPELFFQIGGYDQRLIGWGFEDNNLYIRYQQVSESFALYNRRHLFHIPHSDEMRAHLNPDGEDIGASILRNLATAKHNVDLYGDSWKHDFGYPRIELSPQS